jgi:DNA-binding CsgD family transcriptional regulator
MQIINAISYYREPVDRTPETDFAQDFETLADFAERYHYEALCREYMARRAEETYRPRDLANSPTIRAWIAAVTAEGFIEEFARERGIDADTVARFKVRCRGRGIPKGPLWQLALARALSDRERDVLRILVSTGASNKEIGRRLGIADDTVKQHLASILCKIGAHNRTQAAIWAVTHIPMAEAAPNATP